MKLLYMLTGAVIGLIFVRAFWLDPLEVIAWDIFWKNLGSTDSFDLEQTLQSNTFLKCFSGSVTGSILGFLVYKNRT